MKELDIIPIEPRFKHSTIFKTFDELKEGEAFILKNDHDPVPLKYQFEAEQNGKFSWEYIEQGPEIWKVKIGKTSPK